MQIKTIFFQLQAKDYKRAASQFQAKVRALFFPVVMKLIAFL